MAARWIALALALVTFVIAGFFVGIALWPYTRPTAGDPGQERSRAAIRMATRPWIVVAEVAPRTTGVETTLSVRDEAGQPPAALWIPAAQLRMLDMEMPPVVFVLEQQTPGNWRGLGRIPMSGRWSFVVVIEGEELVFAFSAPEIPRSPSALSTRSSTGAAAAERHSLLGVL